MPINSPRSKLYRPLICLFSMLFGSMLFLSSAIAEDRASSSQGNKSAKSAQDPLAAPEAQATELNIIACSSEIYYRWQPTPPPDSKPKISEPVSEVFSSAILLSAKDEAEARNLVETEAVKEMQKANTLCSETHEQKSLCYAKKFQAVQSSYLQANYSVRKLITSSIEADCLAQAGRCMGTLLKKATCWKEK